MTVLTQAETGYRYSPKQDIEIIACANCSIPFGLTAAFIARRRDDHKSFYCPNGHSNHYSQDNEEEKLRKQVERLESRVRWRDDQLDAATKDARLSRYRIAAAKGQLTKIKNRIAAGVCPVPGCKRSGLGADVVAHIATCHPEFHAHETVSLNATAARGWALWICQRPIVTRSGFCTSRRCMTVMRTA